MDRGVTRVQGGQRDARVLAGQHGVAHERLQDLHAGVEGAAQLAGTIDDGQARRLALPPVAQDRGGLDPGIAGTHDLQRSGHLARSHRA